MGEPLAAEGQLSDHPRRAKAHSSCDRRLWWMTEGGDLLASQRLLACLPDAKFPQNLLGHRDSLHVGAL